MGWAGDRTTPVMQTNGDMTEQVWAGWATDISSLPWEKRASACMLVAEGLKAGGHSPPQLNREPIPKLQSLQPLPTRVQLPFSHSNVTSQTPGRASAPRPGLRMAIHKLLLADHGCRAWDRLSGGGCRNAGVSSSPSPRRGLQDRCPSVSGWLEHLRQKHDQRRRRDACSRTGALDHVVTRCLGRGLQVLITPPTHAACGSARSSSEWLGGRLHGEPH
jgi:hypothetical protein